MGIGKSPSEVELNKEAPIAKESFWSMCFLLGEDTGQYKGPWNSLKNDGIIGLDSYPTTTIFSYKIICK